MSAHELAAFAGGALAVAAAAPACGRAARAALAAAAAGVASAVAAREALLRLGREGREPGAPERRRLLALGGAAGFCITALLAGPWVGTLVALGAPAAVSRILRARRLAYRRAVAEDTPSIASAIADALGGGHSLRGALVESAATLGGAGGAEMRRVAAALGAGQPTGRALEELRARCASPPIDMLVAAALVHNRSGGDLSGLLRRLARAFEEERRLAGEVRAATAQARFTAALVVALPVGGMLLAELLAPGFAAGIAGSSVTAALVALALLLQAIAAVLIRTLGSESR